MMKCKVCGHAVDNADEGLYYCVVCARMLSELDVEPVAPQSPAVPPPCGKTPVPMTPEQAREQTIDQTMQKVESIATKGQIIKRLVMFLICTACACEPFLLIFSVYLGIGLLKYAKEAQGTTLAKVTKRIVIGGFVFGGIVLVAWCGIPLMNLLL